MAFQTPGYFPKGFFPIGYIQNEYFPDYGTDIIETSNWVEVISFDSPISFSVSFSSDITKALSFDSSLGD